MAATSAKIGDHLSALDTPSLITSLPVFEQNVETLFRLLKPSGVNIRPHLKTSKSVAVAQKLAKAGANGFCCAKISEAEVVCNGRIDDVLVTTEIVGDVKVQRLVRLWSKYPKVKTVIDNSIGADAINAAVEALGTGRKIDVLIDLDVGLHRTGIAPEGAVELAKHIASLKNLQLIGVQGYEGHLQHVHSFDERKKACLESMRILTTVAEELRKEGHDIRTVTTGGTGTALFCASVKGVNEVQPGSFVFMDTDYQDALRDMPTDDEALHKLAREWAFKNSLTVLSTVVSKQSPTRVAIDAGLKAMTTDSGMARPLLPGWRYDNMGDEHGWLTWEGEGSPDQSSNDSDPVGFEQTGAVTGQKRALEVGDRVHMIPSHIDPTVNLFDTYYAFRDGKIEEVWKVDARGCSQ